MITVYVWTPMLHDGFGNILTNIRSYEKNKKSSYGNFPSTSNINPMVDPFFRPELIASDQGNEFEKIRSQLKSLVVASRDSTVEEFQRLVGHASLLVELEDGRSEYLSFWPARDEKYFDKSDFIDSYKRDYSNFKMKKHADILVPLLNLNDIKVYEFIRKCKEQRRKGEGYVNYNLFFKNCSTLVMSALHEGAQTSAFAKNKDFFQKALGSLAAAGAYSMFIAVAIDAVKGGKGKFFLNPDLSTQEMLRHLITKDNLDRSLGKKSSLGQFLSMISKSRTLFYTVESVVHTPASVLDYACRLEQLR
jgi:hypothetical protein